MKESSIFNARRSTSFSDSVLCLRKILQNPESNEAWEERLGWITSSQSYRNFDGINGEPTEFDWNIFPGVDTLQLCDKVEDLLSRLGETPENFTRRILFMLMFNDIFLWNKRQWKRMSGTRSSRIFVCKEFWYRTMVIPHSLFIGLTIDGKVCLATRGGAKKRFSSKRQTVFFLAYWSRRQRHQDPAKMDFSVPRRAQYLHT